MSIRYNTYKYPGKFDKTVHIFSGDNEDVIHVIGNVTPIPMGKMEVTPRKTVVKGLQKGVENNVGITVKNVGDAPMIVTKIVSKKKKATYWKGKRHIKAGSSAVITIPVTPQKSGRFMDIIMLYSDARNDIGKGYKAVLTGTVQ